MLRSRSGDAVTVRFVEPRDAEALQNYFRSLTTPLPLQPLPRRHERAAAVAARSISSMSAKPTVSAWSRPCWSTAIETIVGEARYAFDADTASIEFGLSIDDRWQGHGIGKALLKNLECRAAAFGAERLFGDTLRSNDAMIGARPQIRLRLRPSPGDWKLVRFEKHIDVEPHDIPCASWKLAAASRQLATVLTRADELSPVLAHQNRAVFVDVRDVSACP